MALYGAGLRATRPDEAVHWHNEAASRGEVIALCDLALMAYLDPDRAASEPLFRNAAERGFPPAMFMLARIVGEKDPAQAHELWVESDARGHYWSTLSLAREARRRGTLWGSHTSTGYLWRAMELGSGDAAYMLGAYGVGALRRRFWKKARELGVDPDAEPPLPNRRFQWPFGGRDAEPG
jgi:TPR repeat protein